MAIELRAPQTDDLDALFEADGRAFGFTWTAEERAERTPMLPLERFRIAVDGRQVVGIAGSMPFDLTLPGGATVPVGGVTWVAVLATHRRRGLLGRLIGAVHDDIESRGEVASILHASEAAIYGRFGYGAATFEREVRVDKLRTSLRDGIIVADGAVTYAAGDAAAEHQRRIWERFRRQRPGELSRNEAMWSVINSIRSRQTDGLTAASHLHHADGYATFRIDKRWEHAHPVQEVVVSELAALNADAHRALWATLLGIDLTVAVRYRALPFDDPLPSMLTNPRAVLTGDVFDGVWVRPTDVATCFAARTYGTTDRIVIECDGRRWAIDGSPEGASVRSVRTRPDLVVIPQALGPLLLGGVRAGALAAAGSVDARSTDVLRRADRFLLADVEPCSLTGF